MGTTASQITSLAIVYSTVYSGTDQRKLQSSASLAFVWGIHQRPVNSPHKGPVARKMFPSDDIDLIAKFTKLPPNCPIFPKFSWGGGRLCPQTPLAGLHAYGARTRASGPHLSGLELPSRTCNFFNWISNTAPSASKPTLKNKCKQTILMHSELMMYNVEWNKSQQNSVNTA